MRSAGYLVRQFYLKLIERTERGFFMRKFAIAAALASTALAGQAEARNKSFYAGLEGGAMIIEDQQYNYKVPVGGVIRNGLDIETETGFDVAGVVGYDFGGVRTEIELGYKKAELATVTSNTSLPQFPLPSGSFGTLTGQRLSGAIGDSSSLSAMFNAMLDFGPADSWRSDEKRGWAFSIGGGVGISRVEASRWRAFDQAAVFADDTREDLAWQAIASVRRAITPNVDVGVKYRFFNVERGRFKSANGGDLDGRWRSHSLLLALTYNFGSPEAPLSPPVPLAPPPAQPEAPPPQPPAQVGPFLIFFDWDKSDITPEASAILDRAVEQYQQTGQTSVQIAGFTDTSGTNTYNQGLSERRAANTKAYMVGKGVPDGSISSQGFGETRLLVQTADGVREPQNRRAEVNFGGGSM